MPTSGAAAVATSLLASADGGAGAAEVCATAGATGGGIASVVEATSLAGAGTDSPAAGFAGSVSAVLLSASSSSQFCY